MTDNNLSAVRQLRNRVVYSPISTTATNTNIHKHHRQPLIRQDEMLLHNHTSPPSIKWLALTILTAFVGIASYYYMSSSSSATSLSNQISCEAQIHTLLAELKALKSQIEQLHIDKLTYKQEMEHKVHSQLQQYMTTAHKQHQSVQDLKYLTDFSQTALVDTNLTSATLSWETDAKNESSWLFNLLFPSPRAFGIHPAQILHSQNTQCWPTLKHPNAQLTLRLSQNVSVLHQIGIASKDEFHSTTPKVVDVYALSYHGNRVKLGQIRHDIDQAQSINHVKWSFLDVSTTTTLGSFKWSQVHSIQFHFVSNFGNTKVYCLFRVGVFGLGVPQHPLAAAFT